MKANQPKSGIKKITSKDSLPDESPSVVKKETKKLEDHLTKTLSPDWTQKTQAVSSFLLLILSLITLPLITKQVYLGNRDVTSGSQSTIYDRSQQILLFMADDPRLYDYFYKGKEVENGVDSVLLNKIRIAAMMYGDLFEQIALCTYDIDNETTKGWINWIKDVYKSSPPIQKLFREREYWYSPFLLKHIDLIESNRKDTNAKEYFFMDGYKN